MAFYCINYTTGVDAPGGGTAGAPWQTIAYAETQINGGTGPQIGDEFRIQDETVKTLLGTGRYAGINSIGTLSFNPLEVMVAGDIIMIGDSVYPCWTLTINPTTITAGSGSANPMWTGLDQEVDLPIYKITGSIDLNYTNSASPPLDTINAANSTFTPGANDVIISGGWDATFTAKTAFGRTHIRRVGSGSSTTVSNVGYIFDVGKMFGYQFKDFVYNRLIFADEISTAVPTAVFNMDNIVMTGTASAWAGLPTSTATDVFTNTFNDCYFNIGTSSNAFTTMATNGQSIVVNNPTLVFDSGWTSVSGSFFSQLNGSNAASSAKYLRVSVTGTVSFINTFNGSANPQFPIQGGTINAMSQATSYQFLKTGRLFFATTSSGVGGWSQPATYNLNATSQMLGLLYKPVDSFNMYGNLNITAPGFIDAISSPGEFFNQTGRGVVYGPKGDNITWTDTVANKTYRIDNYSAWKLNTTDHTTGQNCIEWNTGTVNKNATEQLLLNSINVEDGQTLQFTISMKTPTGSATPSLALIFPGTLNGILNSSQSSNAGEPSGLATYVSGTPTTTYSNIVYTFTTPLSSTVSGKRTAFLALTLDPTGQQHDYFVDSITIS